MMIKFHKDETYFSRISPAAKGTGGEQQKKDTSEKTEVPFESGDRRSRTDDPLLAKQML